MTPTPDTVNMVGTVDRVGDTLVVRMTPTPGRASTPPPIEARPTPTTLTHLGFMHYVGPSTETTEIIDFCEQHPYAAVVVGWNRKTGGQRYTELPHTARKRRRRVRRVVAEPIPTWVRFKEAARRLAAGFSSDLRDAASKPGKSTRSGSGENPWTKCGDCFHRVPELCVFCRRGRAGVADTHPTACCPGECRRCHRCLDECPGPCDRCDNCLDRCTCKER